VKITKTTKDKRGIYPFEFVDAVATTRQAKQLQKEIAKAAGEHAKQWPIEARQATEATLADPLNEQAHLEARFARQILDGVGKAISEKRFPDAVCLAYFLGRKVEMLVAMRAYKDKRRAVETNTGTGNRRNKNNNDATISNYFYAAIHEDPTLQNASDSKVAKAIKNSGCILSDGRIRKGVATIRKLATSKR